MFVSRPDAQLASVCFGTGPRTLVALGGWIGSWELWLEPFCLLSSSWRTIAFDHRGTGATLASPETISFSTLVDDLFAVLDAYSVEQCVLAAESAGAAIALQAVLLAPHRFSALVIVDGLYHRQRPGGVDPFVASLQADFQATLSQFVQACVPERNSAAIRHWGGQILSRSTLAAAVQLYESLYQVDLRPQIGQIKQPSLIIHGQADQIVPLSAAEWLAAQLPTSELLILAGAGHVPTLTQPELIAKAIEQFCAAYQLA
jgi:pimeloyl-ACP methyl ester carboxylesterase